jgi:hypothetical protein
MAGVWKDGDWLIAWSTTPLITIRQLSGVPAEPTAANPTEAQDVGSPP